jgi:hypothetical protein
VKYFAIAVEDDSEDVFAETFDLLFPGCPIKQVVLDQIDFSEVETLS